MKSTSTPICQQPKITYPSLITHLGSCNGSCNGGSENLKGVVILANSPTSGMIVHTTVSAEYNEGVKLGQLIPNARFSAPWWGPYVGTITISSIPAQPTSEPK